MEDIRRTSLITAGKIDSLSTKASQIGAILTVINEVTAQTDLLALNAAIIAAQAGEKGKGFAVVSSEIRELSDRTKESTRMIADVIKGVQEETAEAVQAVRATEGSVQQGVLLSGKSGEALDKIVSGVQRSASSIDEIARASAKQSIQSQMINSAMELVTQMVAHIRNSTHEQQKESKKIMSAVEEITTLNSSVRFSTREQSKTGQAIARSTENITEMIAQIRRACEEQAGSSQRIFQAVGNIEEITNVNLQAAIILDESVSRMSGQVNVMKDEMRVFKTDKDSTA
jgi:methyl-accepting chemotaxis protein